MPLEICELFSMAPLSGWTQSTEYVIPLGFALGSGEVRALQEQLITKYQTLACHRNSYLKAQSMGAHYGLDPFQGMLDKAKQAMKVERDATIKLMKAVYQAGHVPLPPNQEVDSDISKVLVVSLISDEARGAVTAEIYKAESRAERKYDLTSKCPVESVFISALRSLNKVNISRPGQVDACVSRGAAARARAEAAWNTRARMGRMGRRCHFLKRCGK